MIKLMVSILAAATYFFSGFAAAQTEKVPDVAVQKAEASTPTAGKRYRVVSDEEIRSRLQGKKIEGYYLLIQGQPPVTFTFEAEGVLKVSDASSFFSKPSWKVEDGLVMIHVPSWPVPFNNPSKAQVWDQGNGKIDIGRWFREK